MLQQRWIVNVCVCLCLFVAPAGILAQENSSLQMIKKGPFKLNEGDTVYLTDRKILLRLFRVVGDDGENARRVGLKLNGSGGSTAVGMRIDLKKRRKVREDLKDVGVCILDIVEAAKPRGAAPYATFELLCE